MSSFKRIAGTAAAGCFILHESVSKRGHVKS